MIENLKKLEKALKEDKELAAKFEAEILRIAREKDVANDGEAFVKAAKAVGFDISIADLEKAKAETQELAPEEIEKSAGGWCWGSYDCYTAWHHDTPNEKGTACLADYDCISINKNSKFEEIIDKYTGEGYDSLEDGEDYYDDMMDFFGGD